MSERDDFYKWPKAAVDRCMELRGQLAAAEVEIARLTGEINGPNGWRERNQVLARLKSTPVGTWALIRGQGDHYPSAVTDMCACGARLTCPNAKSTTVDGEVADLKAIVDTFNRWDLAHAKCETCDMEDLAVVIQACDELYDHALNELRSHRRAVREEGER